MAFPSIEGLEFDSRRRRIDVKHKAGQVIRSVGEPG